MARNKRLYYYDTETCAYEEAGFSWQSFFVKSGLLTGIAALVIGMMYFVFPEEISAFKLNHLSERKAELQGQLALLDGRLDQKEIQLKRLLSRDNGIYLPIVGERNISRSEWEGGTGGSLNVSWSDRQTASFRLQQRINKLNYQIDLLESSFKKVRDRAADKEDLLRNLPSIQPTTGMMISGFGNRRHPISGHTKFHGGLDFSCPTGTPVYATGNGQVELAEYNKNGFGKCIKIDHLNGYSSRYAHLSRMLVKEGQKISRGDLIGYSGSTGRSTGPHLHYEIERNHIKIDPIGFFYADLSPEKYHEIIAGHSAEAVSDTTRERIYHTAPMD